MGAAAPIFAGASLLTSIIGDIEQNKQQDKAAKALRTQQGIDNTNAANLAKQTLEQPKVIAPDNFMAQKASQLSKLRLGMGSTMTGAGLAQPAAALTPASALKSKLGA